MVALVPNARQIPLIHLVESDDLFLQDQVDVVWFDVLQTRVKAIAPSPFKKSLLLVILSLLVFFISIQFEDLVFET